MHVFPPYFRAAPFGYRLFPALCCLRHAAETLAGPASIKADITAETLKRDRENGHKQGSIASRQKIPHHSTPRCAVRCVFNQVVALV